MRSGDIIRRAAALPLLTGVATASEVMAALADGLHLLKLFPASAAGSIAMLKAQAGSSPDVFFCPAGGITAETAAQFLVLPNVNVCGGSWLTPPDAVLACEWARTRSWRVRASPCVSKGGLEGDGAPAIPQGSSGVIRPLADEHRNARVNDVRLSPQPAAAAQAALAMCSRCAR